MKALVIDRSKLMRILLRRILVRRGYEVMDLASPWERTAGWEDAEIVFVEWDLRSREVPELISSSRRNGAQRSIFVVLANSEPETRELMRAEISGADHILVKPFTSAQLDSVLFGGETRFEDSQRSLKPTTGFAPLITSECTRPAHTAA